MIDLTATGFLIFGLVVGLIIGFSLFPLISSSGTEKERKDG